jgi:hypothetical protein
LNSGPKLEGKKPERFPPQNNFLMPKSEEWAGGSGFQLH